MVRVAVALVFFCALAAPAQAVFPGSDGRLVVNASVYQPPSATPLTWPWGQISLLRFSADDLHVAGVDFSNNSIWVANIDGSDARQLTTPPGQDIDDVPAWSPDGSQIAFERSVSGGEEIDLVDVSTGAVSTVLGPDPTLFIQSLDWSPVPDSTQLVMTDGSSVQLVDTSTGATTTLASGAEYADARFSPDGESVVASLDDYEAGSATIVVLPIGGGTGLTFSANGSTIGVTEATYTPDGQGITYNGCQPGTSPPSNCGIWTAILPPSDAPPGTAPTYRQELAGDGFEPSYVEWEPLIDVPIISSGPGQLVNTADATFEFSIPSTDTGTYQCQLDGGGFSDCTSPMSYSGLDDGNHTFEVRFVPTGEDPDDQTPATWNWKVDTTPPEALITQAPSGTVTDTDATIVFTSSEPDGATYQCSLDGAPFTDCSSPDVLTGLDDGTHTFSVKATDAAGNTQDDATTVSWQVAEPSGGGGGGGGGAGGGGGSSGGGGGSGGTTPPETPTGSCGKGQPSVTIGVVIAVGRGGTCFIKTSKADGSAVYTASGTISINGVELTPSGPIIITQSGSSATVEIPAGTTMGFGSFTWTLSDDIKIPVSAAAGALHFLLPMSGKQPYTVAGLEVAVTPDFQLTKADGGTSDITLKIALPSVFGAAGEAPAGGKKAPSVNFKFEFLASNDTGVRFKFNGTVPDTFLFGVVEVQTLSVGLDVGTTLTFDGSAVLKFPGSDTTFALEVALSGNGDQPWPLVNKLSLQASGINKMLADGIYLQRLGGEFKSCTGTDRVPGGSLSANAGISVGPELDISPIFKGIPVELDGQATLYMCAPDSLSVAGVGTVVGMQIADGDVTYTFDTGKVTLDGNLNLTIGGYGFTAKITDSFFDFSGGTWNIDATGTAKLPAFLGDVLNGQGEMVVSSNGFAICFGSPGSRYGFAQHWGQSLDQTDNCDVGPYRADASSARDAAADQFTIPHGERIAELTLHGTSAPPAVSLIGPAGERIDIPVDGRGLQNGQAVVIPNPDDDTTTVVLLSPHAGGWTVAPEPGGTAASSFQIADGLPPAHVSGKVRGSGARRTLTWSLKPVAGQKVTFVELGTGVTHTLASTTRAHGTLRFTPVAGTAGRARRIEALVTQNGLLRITFVIASFTAPAPPRLRAVGSTRLTGSVLHWAAQAAATEYSVLVRDDSTGATTTSVTRHASLKLPASMHGHRLTVTITALGAGGQIGPLRIVTLRAAAKLGVRS